MSRQQNRSRSLISETDQVQRTGRQRARVQAQTVVSPVEAALFDDGKAFHIPIRDVA